MGLFLRWFSSSNPTCRYRLRLGIPAERLAATRLADVRVTFRSMSRDILPYIEAQGTSPSPKERPFKIVIFLLGSASALCLSNPPLSRSLTCAACRPLLPLLVDVIHSPHARPASSTCWRGAPFSWRA